MSDDGMGLDSPPPDLENKKAGAPTFKIDAPALGYFTVQSAQSPSVQLPSVHSPPLGLQFPSGQ